MLGLYDSKRLNFWYNFLDGNTDVCIIDEAQAIKNYQAGMTREIKKIKALTEKYSAELKSLGISVKEGYMSISSTASTNISPDKYEELFGKDSSYMKELSALAKKMNRSVDISL